MPFARVPVSALPTSPLVWGQNSHAAALRAVEAREQSREINNAFMFFLQICTEILHIDFPLRTSYGVQQLSSRRNHQNPVMSSVRYGQSLLNAVYGHLPGERQDAGRQGVSVQLDAHCVCLEEIPLPVVMQGAGRKQRQPLAVAFAHQGEEQVAAWAQQDQRGPAGHLQVMPEARLAVVHHRVADVIAEHGAADIVQGLRRGGGEEQRQMSEERRVQN